MKKRETREIRKIDKGGTSLQKIGGLSLTLLFSRLIDYRYFSISRIFSEITKYVRCGRITPVDYICDCPFKLTKHHNWCLSNSI
ncbi:hypothetical protein PspCFBP13509_05525 [Pseudomonas sp. CFBP13509]|nr:hypothetical protein PspCFBP13509_05525 [Pseudomonas sp. CFBP13509]